MADERLDMLAKILVNYSTRVKPGDKVMIDTNVAAIPLVERVVYQILKAGGYPEYVLDVPSVGEIILEYATDDQVDQFPVFRFLLSTYQTFDCVIGITAWTNTKWLNNMPPERVSRVLQAFEPILKTRFKREANGELRRVNTLYPTSGYAQDAGMGNKAYEEFFFQACQVEIGKDPVISWLALEERHQELIAALVNRDNVILRGKNCDLRFSIRERTFLSDHGLINMPGGEIYTGPVENSVNGWVHFDYPGTYVGRNARGIELHFVDGRVEKASASGNEEFLLNTLSSDEGASHVGEFGIGTNKGIRNYTGNILFDEKIAGTMHLAMGRGYPQTGSTNESSIHWDMIFDTRQDFEMIIDGDLIYTDGEFKI